MNRSGRFGVRGRLLLSFLGISAFAILAGTAALYTFSEVGDAIRRITSNSLPSTIASLELSRQAEQILSAAPRLIRARSESERQEAYDQIAGNAEKLVEQLTELDRMAPQAQALIQTRIAPMVYGFEGNLQEIDHLVEQQLALADKRQALLRRLTSAVLAAQTLARLGDAQVGSDIAELRSRARGSDNQDPSLKAAFPDLAERLTQALSRRRAEALISHINDALQRVTTASATMLPTLQLPLPRSIDELDNLTDTFEQSIRQSIKGSVATLREFSEGEGSLIEIRKQELMLARKVDRSLAEFGELSQHLTAAVNQLVNDAKADIAVATSEVFSVQGFSSAIVIGVVILSLVSSGLIVWLYVDRTLVARLQALSESMLAIAGGSLRAPLPVVTTRDEVGRMAEALIVFRDTAVEVEENNLRQIAQARQRLIDALESTSEGFAFFDAEDRLELCNSRYRQLLHSGDDEIIRPGTPFETILRTAAARGAIRDAAVDVESWVQNRLAQHQDPGEQHIQRRGDGRWIRISERRTDDGGIVAVYSDITELKQREQQVAESEQRLTDAIESISEGFCLFDADDHLVLSNSRYRELYRGHDDVIEPGVSFETVVRTAVDRGVIGDALGRQEDWILERLAQHRQPSGTHLLAQSDGRWIQISERRTHDGGIVGVYSDVTELKKAAAEIEHKNQELESLSSKLAKYLSPQVYESIFSGKQEVKIASQRKKLTVLFSDIAGFTETTDKLESEELTQLLNHYLTEMSRVAHDYGATIDKYVGDAIVIFFGDPESRGAKDDALACVKMAIAMQKRLRQLQGLWRDAGIEQPLRCRIGISTGYCTVGNFGSEDRMDYTIHGGGANLASRLEKQAPPGRILISYETYALVKGEVCCEERGHVEVKGIAYPVTTYEVIDLYENLSEQPIVIHEELPNIKIDLDLDSMSADEWRKAVGLLQRTLDRLSAFELDARVG